MLRIFVNLYIATSALILCSSCREVIYASSDSRVVYITPTSSKGDSIACVEPGLKAPDSYKEVVDVVTEESMSGEAFPKENLVKYGNFERSINVQEKTTFLKNRSVRIHNMREILFELCQAYANQLIDLGSYSRFLEIVIEKTAALHAMEILLYHLDQEPHDEATRERLMKLARDIIFRHEMLVDQPNEVNESAKHME